MQERDVLLKEYWSDNGRFSDLLNGYLFGGRQVIKACDVTELDGQSFEFSGSAGMKTTGQKQRDILRRMVFGVNFCIVGVENQTQIHYAMPLRVMEADTGRYGRQLRAVQKRHRTRKDLKGAEFLSGFSRQDKVQPVFTLVLYYGTEPWNGADDLFGMIDWSEIPAEMAGYLNNYRINLLDVPRFESLERFRTDVRVVFGFLRYSYDKEKLASYVKQNQEIFCALEEDAYDVICALTGTKELEMVKAKYYQENGGVDMCKAIQDMIRDSRKEGFEQAAKVISLYRAGHSEQSIAGECHIAIEEVRRLTSLI